MENHHVFLGLDSRRSCGYGQNSVHPAGISAQSADFFRTRPAPPGTPAMRFRRRSTLLPPGRLGDRAAGDPETGTEGECRDRAGLTCPLSRIVFTNIFRINSSQPSLRDSPQPGPAGFPGPRSWAIVIGPSGTKSQGCPMSLEWESALERSSIRAGLPPRRGGLRIAQRFNAGDWWMEPAKSPVGTTERKWSRKCG